MRCIPSIPLSGLTLFLLLFFFGGAAHGEEDPRRVYEDEVFRIRAEGEEANARVQTALTARDWAGWCNAHSAYARVLATATNQLEIASTRFLFGMLSRGETLDNEALQAIDTAGEIAGRFARQRVVTNAWAALTRQGIRPDRRTAALALLEKQGVYHLDGEAPLTDECGASPVTRSSSGKTGPSPFNGRIPSTPEAAEYLSKWQYAHMQAESAERAIQASEAELATVTSEDTRIREQVEKRLLEAQQSYKDLQQAVLEWRRKYFESGGR